MKTIPSAKFQHKGESGCLILSPEGNYLMVVNFPKKNCVFFHHFREAIPQCSKVQEERLIGNLKLINDCLLEGFPTKQFDIETL